MKRFSCLNLSDGTNATVLLVRARTVQCSMRFACAAGNCVLIASHAPPTLLLAAAFMPGCTHVLVALIAGGRVARVAGV